MRGRYLLRSIAIVVCILAASFVIPSAMPASEGPVEATISGYVLHDPIVINGDGDFSKKGFPGSGTLADPYRIEGFEIDASKLNGITISNVVSSYFVIKDCLIYESGSQLHISINMYNSFNGSIMGNSISGTAYGIFLNQSDIINLNHNTCSNNIYPITIDHFETPGGFNVVANNTCELSDYGIGLIDAHGNLSHNNTIINNLCSKNHIGICLYRSPDNRIINNTVVANEYGLWSDDSNRTIIAENLFDSNLNHGVSIFSSTANHIWNNTFHDNNGATDYYNGAHIQGYDSGYGNYWNDTNGHGNWWNDWDSPDEIPPWGTVDLAYSISGSALANDYYPRIRIALSELGPLSVFITSPTSSSSYHTNWGWIKLMGTAADDAAVTSVRWANDRGGFGIMYMDPQYGGAYVSWQTRGQMPLYSGANRITVFAYDNGGNITADILTVIYERVPPTVVITSPTSNPSCSVSSTTIDFAGTAADASGISSVVWKNMATGTSGTATGNTSWSVTGLALNAGMNLIYVNATDNAGNRGTDAIWVTYSIDTLAVTITAPTSNPTMTTSWHMIKLMGTATDDGQVVWVTWTNSLGGSGAAYCSPQWGPSVSWQSRGNVHLLPGDNEITVTAYDNAGHTKTDKIGVTYTGLE